MYHLKNNLNPIKTLGVLFLLSSVVACDPLGPQDIQPNTSPATYQTQADSMNVHIDSDDLIRAELNAMLQKIEENPKQVNISSKLRERTALHCATRLGEIKIVQTLLKLKADTTLKDCYGATPFEYAARKKNLVLMNIFLSCSDKNQVSGLDYEGKTILHWAVQNDHLRLTQLLLSQQNIEVNAIDAKGKTPLHWAVQNGHVMLTQLLLSQQNIEVNAIDASGKTPLHLAAESGHVMLTRLLLAQQETQVNAIDANGKTPLHLAAIAGHVEVSQLLLENIKTSLIVRDKSGLTAFHYAVGKGHIQILDLIRKLHIDVNKLVNDCHQGLLHLAAQSNNLEIAEMLLKTTNIDINAADPNGFTALHMALLNGHVDIMRLLLEQPGVQFNAQASDSIALLMAVATSHSEEIVQLLLTKSVDFNIQDQRGRTPLHMAAIGGCTATVQLLLEQPGVQFDTPDKIMGQTPLCFAVQKGQVDIIKLLLKAGANPNLLDKEGKTPVDQALEKGNREILKMLLTHLGNKIKTHYQGQPFFHILLEKGYVEIFEMLSSCHPQLVNVKLEDNNGFTLLHLAVRQSLSKIVHILLNYEDIDVNQGIVHTPLYVAASKGYVEIVNILLKHPDIEFNLCGVAQTTPFEIAKLQLNSCKTHDERAKYQAIMAALTVKADEVYEKNRLLPSPYNRL